MKKKNYETKVGKRRRDERSGSKYQKVFNRISYIDHEINILRDEKDQLILNTFGVREHECLSIENLVYIIERVLQK